MGRGRAKAKQTKVARELKYNAPNTDLSALERELHSATFRSGFAAVEADDADDDEEDEWEAEDDSDTDSVYDDYGKWASGQR